MEPIMQGPPGWRLGLEEAGLKGVFVELRCSPARGKEGGTSDGGGGAIPRGFSLPYNFPPCSDGWISRPSPTFPIPCWPGPRGCEIPISVGSGWDKVNGM